MVDIERARKLQDAITREAQKFSFQEAMHALAATVAAAVATADIPVHNREKVLSTFMANVLLALQKIDARDDPLSSSMN